MNYLKLTLLIYGLSLNTYCQAQFSIEVISAPQNTLCNGQLKVNTSTNTGPYSFAWSNGEVTQQVKQLVGHLTVATFLIQKILEVVGNDVENQYLTDG
jgi:hypothetical protein